MKKFFLIAAAVLLTIAGCNKPNDGGKDDPTPSGKENTPITLAASTTTPVMDKDHQRSEEHTSELQSR